VEEVITGEKVDRVEIINPVLIGKSWARVRACGLSILVYHRCSTF
jgi:hypothetical protein